MKKHILILILMVSAVYLQGQDQFTVMTYNLLNYGNTTSYCTSSNNNFTDKEHYLQDIVAYYQPDILGINEMGSNSYLAGRVLDSVFNVNPGWNYAMSGYSNVSGTSLVNMLYYDANKFGLANQHVLHSQIRDIILYRLYFKAEDLATSQDTAFLNIVLSHLKAGSGSSEKQTRAQEISAAMASLTALYPSGNYLWMGDFNIYSSSESAFQQLVNPSNAAYTFNDPINESGNWNNNSSYRAVHTQSTHSSSNGCASGGGLDDRFDMILTSDAILNGTEHYRYISGSYTTPGNDGQHFNGSITSGSNNSAPASMIQTLYNMSDHLPVMLTLEVDQVVGVHEAAQSSWQVSIQNPVQNKVSVHIRSQHNTGAKLYILNTAGQVHMQQDLELHNAKQEVEIDCSGWKPGLYCMRMIGENGDSYTTKILKI